MFQFEQPDESKRKILGSESELRYLAVTYAIYLEACARQTSKVRLNLAQTPVTT